jgi:hypothetical protein
MMYRGSGFLALVWFGSSSPSSLYQQQVVSVSHSFSRRVDLTDGGGGRGWGRSQTIGINHSILFVVRYCDKWHFVWQRPSHLRCSSGSILFYKRYRCFWNAGNFIKNMVSKTVEKQWSPWSRMELRGYWFPSRSRQLLNVYHRVAHINKQ